MLTCPYFYNCYRYIPNTKIVINTHNDTLTLFKGNNIYKSYKVAVGKPSTPTPKGTYKIVNREMHPSGPFGVYWLGLNIPHGAYGIHGTNSPSSIGKKISHGCIRMQNNDIIELSHIVPIGTKVIII